MNTLALETAPTKTPSLEPVAQPQQRSVATAPEKATSISKPSSGQLRRAMVVCVVMLLTLAAIGLAVPWGFYRYQNLVLSQASVKGTVTRIGARMEGRVKSVEVQVGQSVSKGQVLVHLEDKHLEAALTRARAELAAATKDLETEKMDIEHCRRCFNLEIDKVKGSRKKAVGELESQISVLTDLQKQYDRSVALVKSGAAASSDLDRATADRDRARALSAAAQGSLETIESTHQRAVADLEGLKVRESRLTSMEAQVSVARARVASAEADLESATLRAPEDGKVLERIVEAGGSARVGEPMLALWIGKPWVEAWSSEKDLHRIKVGSQADVVIDAVQGHKLAGQVESIGLMSDRQLNPAVVPADLHTLIRQDAMVPIRIALLDEDPAVNLGLSAKVGIRRSSKSSASHIGAPQAPTAITASAKP